MALDTWIEVGGHFLVRLSAINVVNSGGYIDPTSLEPVKPFIGVGSAVMPISPVELKNLLRVIAADVAISLPATDPDHGKLEAMDPDILDLE